MPADTCGARNGALVCDRAPHADGDHRGYLEAVDEVLFWPSAEKQITTIADVIAKVLDGLELEQRAAAAARLRAVIDRRSPAPRGRRS